MCYNGQWALFIVTFIYALLIFAAAIYKIAKNEDGWYNYIRHFTNWSWTFQGFYYLFASLIFIEGELDEDDVDASGKSKGTVFAQKLYTIGQTTIALCFFPLVAIIFSVAIGITVVLLVEDDGSDTFWDALFEKYDNGLVLFGNDFYHMYPVIAILFHVIFASQLIFMSINAFFIEAYRNTAQTVLYFLYNIFLASTLIVVLYAIVLEVILGENLLIVYNIDLSMLEAIGLHILIAIIICGIPLLILWYYYDLGQQSLLQFLIENGPYRPEVERLKDIYITIMLKPPPSAKYGKIPPNLRNYDTTYDPMSFGKLSNSSSIYCSDKMLQTLVVNGLRRRRKRTRISSKEY